MSTLTRSAETPSVRSPKATGRSTERSTARAIDELLNQGSSSPEQPDTKRSPTRFRETLERLAASHLAESEDHPESDLAFQALLKPITERLVVLPTPTPAEKEFMALKQFHQPDRPRTSPSRLALSVTQSLDSSSLKERLKRLDPCLPPNLKGAAVHEPEALKERAPGGSDRDDTDFNATRASSAEHEHQAEPRRLGEPFRLAALTGSRDQAPARTPGMSAPERAPVMPQLATSPPEPPTMTAARPTPSSLSSPYLRTSLSAPARARARMKMELEGSTAQRVELQIKDTYGEPLTLKIAFEAQRARATCVGAHLARPEQLEHVLDAVRTAIEASGFELGDFILHHERDRRGGENSEGLLKESLVDEAGSEEQGGDEAGSSKGERSSTLHIVGIINRIA